MINDPDRPLEMGHPIGDPVAPTLWSRYRPIGLSIMVILTVVELTLDLNGDLEAILTVVYGCLVLVTLGIYAHGKLAHRAAKRRR